MSRTTPLLTLLVLAVWSGVAHADQDAAQAEQLFNKGKAAMAAGKLAEACEAFAASDHLDTSVSTLMNLGDCREKNHQLASAWEAFVAVERKARGDAGYGKLAEIAGARAAALEPRLSWLTINVSDEVRVEGLKVLRDGALIEPGAWNTALPVDGGEHVITGSAPGHEAWSTKVSVADEGERQAVEVPRFKAIRNPGGAGAGKTVVINRYSPSIFTTRRKIALGLGGAGVVAIGAGLALGLSSNRAADNATSLCPDVMCSSFAEANRLNQQSRDRALYANVAFGVGAAAIAGAAVLWITGRPSDVQPTITASVGVQQVAAAVEVRF